MRMAPFAEDRLLKWHAEEGFRHIAAGVRSRNANLTNHHTGPLLVRNFIQGCDTFLPTPPSSR